MFKFLVYDMELYVLYRPFNATADSIAEIAEIVRLAGKNRLFIRDFSLPDIDLGKGVMRGRAATLLEAAENMMEQLVSFLIHLKGICWTWY